MSWDINKLMQWFQIEIVESILKIPISPDCFEDNWIWTPIQSGEFDVKSNLHDRLKMLIWRIVTRCLPTKESLSRFIDGGDTRCLLCNLELESFVHLFALCPVTKGQQGLRMEVLGLSTDLDFIQLLFPPSPL